MHNSQYFIEHIEAALSYRKDELANASSPYASIAERLKKWDPTIDPSKLVLIDVKPVTWNDGSLGCPLPGHCYTQALVPGFSLLFQYGDRILEVHTDRALKKIALPDVGFIPG